MLMYNIIIIITAIVIFVVVVYFCMHISGTLST